MRDGFLFHIISYVRYIIDGLVPDNIDGVYILGWLRASVSHILLLLFVSFYESRINIAKYVAVLLRPESPTGFFPMESPMRKLFDLSQSLFSIMKVIFHYPRILILSVARTFHNLNLKIGTFFGIRQKSSRLFPAGKLQLIKAEIIDYAFFLSAICLSIESLLSTWQQCLQGLIIVEVSFIVIPFQCILVLFLMKCARNYLAWEASHEDFAELPSSLRYARKKKKLGNLMDIAILSYLLSLADSFVTQSRFPQ